MPFPFEFQTDSTLQSSLPLRFLTTSRMVIISELCLGIFPVYAIFIPRPQQIIKDLQRRIFIMEVDFDWHDEYSIGVDEIDAQHKRFLKLIKGTYELKDKTSEHEEVRKLLHELMRYALFHFNSEEFLMKTYLYPKYMEQKIQHDKIIKELGWVQSSTSKEKGKMLYGTYTTTNPYRR